MLTARATNKAQRDQRNQRLQPIIIFACDVSGIVSVGLKAVAFVSDT